MHADSLCMSPEAPYVTYLSQVLARVNFDLAESNESSVAYIIASALSARHRVSIDAGAIATTLKQATQQRRPVSLLDVKQSINRQGYTVTATMLDHATDLQDMMDRIIITRDREQNYLAIVAASPTYAYLIYGIYQHHALICPISWTTMQNGFVSNKVLLVQ